MFLSEQSFYQSSVLSGTVGMWVSKMFSFDKMFFLGFCSDISYMGLVPFHQSFQLPFFSVYLTAFPFILLHSVGFTPFLFACSELIVPVAFVGGGQVFLGEDVVPQVLRSPF